MADLPMPQPGDPMTAEAAVSVEGLSSVAWAGRVAQVLVTLIELSPANEAVRIAVWSAAGGVSHNPEFGALSFGLATLVVEAAGAAVAAPLFHTQASQRFTALLNAKIARVRKHNPAMRFSAVTKATAVLFGGSVLGMALMHREDPSRPVAELRLYGLKASLWLALACAVQGALMSLGVAVGLNHPLPVLVVVGAVLVLGLSRWMVKKQRNPGCGSGIFG